MKIFLPTKKQNGFSKRIENSRSCGQPKCQNLPFFKIYFAKKAQK